ncbi:glutaredoxin-like protein NrdH [Mycolicibacterium sp. BiH015]|uniref:glutaredoxin-like protein NrdH n=1 Tax=Mycolicibacterium sp. BiH015 TaxID=3018808 RepID=UPI0022E6D40C|nr:glutaredoxin-like protein NrdH [Mycolicibacterium sp. BiH015]MDA2893372.1 glutaredoxin-like protein NrdH [Mycolicibacterium sp. BiH015]
MHSITVYTKPGCPQCRATTRALDRAGLDYECVDISTDPEERDFVMSLGYLQAPIVVAADRHWSGFRPDHITDLATDVA